MHGEVRTNQVVCKMNFVKCLKKKKIKISTVSRYAIHFIMNYCKCVQVVNCAFQLDLKSVVNYSIQIRESLIGP